MNIEDVKEGDVLTAVHARKGVITVKAGKQDEKSEWFNATVVGKRVTGLVNDWEEGESLPLRKSLILKISKHD